MTNNYVKLIYGRPVIRSTFEQPNINITARLITSKNQRICKYLCWLLAGLFALSTLGFLRTYTFQWYETLAIYFLTLYGCLHTYACMTRSKLTRLDFAFSVIGNENAKTLANAIRKSTVTHLDLQSTKIGDEGAKDIAQSLYDSPLIGLNLSNNSIGNEGALALLKALPYSNLRYLDLWANRLDTIVLNAIKTCMRTHHFAVIVLIAAEELPTELLRMLFTEYLF
jgi:hypothetical protein